MMLHTGNVATKGKSFSDDAALLPEKPSSCLDTEDLLPPKSKCECVNLSALSNMQLVCSKTHETDKCLTWLSS